MSETKAPTLATLIEFVRDLADQGIRFDLQPTLTLARDYETAKRTIDELHVYLKRIDESIRDRAKVALGEKELIEVMVESTTKPVQCITCSGFGWVCGHSGAGETCPKCHGHGYTR